MAGLGRAVRGEAVVERCAIDCLQGCHRGAGDEAIEQHGDARPARRDDGARHRRQFAPAEPAHDLERIVERVRMRRDARLDDGGLAANAGLVDTGARPDPVGRPAAVARAAERGGDGRVADAHLADAQQIGARVELRHAERDGVEKVHLVHRRSLREIAGRRVERQRVDAEIGADRRAELVNRRTAGREVADHLLGHRGRERRDALRRDAMIAGEDEHLDAFGAGRIGRLPRRHPCRDVLEPGERAGRLGELGVARLSGRAASFIGAGQLGDQAAQVVEGVEH